MEKLVDDSLVKILLIVLFMEGGRGKRQSPVAQTEQRECSLAVKPKARCIPAGVALIKSSSLSMALPSKFPFDRNGIPSKRSNIELCPFYI